MLLSIMQQSSYLRVFSSYVYIIVSIIVIENATHYKGKHCKNQTNLYHIIAGYFLGMLIMSPIIIGIVYQDSLVDEDITDIDL